VLIEIGVNLGHRQFARDRELVLARARAAGVVHQIVTGTSLGGSRDAVGLAAAHADLSATAGLHPHVAKELDASTLPALRELAARRDPRGRRLVVAIGECGLDYDRDFSPRDQQRRAFGAQLGLAAELGLPVFLHERAAHADFVAILREHRASLPGAVVHCFTGDEAELERYLELDAHIGITGWICDERRGTALRRAAPGIPPDRLMLETDAPFLLPRGAPRSAGRRNEPAFLPLVLAAVARATARSEDSVADASTATARRFFGLPEAV
jgi:TatD DNase family protein